MAARTVTGRDHQAEARDAGHGLRGEHAQNAEDDRRQAAREQQRGAKARGFTGLVSEQQRPAAQQDIEADLAEDGENRSDGGRCRRIGAEQPEAHWPHRRLHEEGHGKDRRTDFEQDPVLAGECGNARGKIGHVECSGDAVDQRDADQEEERGGQVDDDVVQTRLHAPRARSVQQQAVGRGQHHLEEDEQVEQVAGEEGAVHPHDEELEEGMEVGPGRMPARDGEDQRGGREDGRQQDQHGRQTIEHQHDAERRRPVAQEVDAGLVRVSRLHEDDGDRQVRQRGEEVDQSLQELPSLVVDRQQCSRHEREHDGGDDQVMCPARHHRSWPST